MSKYIETEISLPVPLDYQNPQGSTIQLFARDIYVKGQEQADILVFFNGGPGFSCLRDWRHSDWVVEALKTHRVVLLDQRGTGRSQPVDRHSLALLGDGQAIGRYLSHFRADNIVRDTEYLRAEVFKREQIIVLGQSFGGFVVLTYLSLAPQSLSKALITAGVAPLLCTSVEAVYQALAKTVMARNEAFYRRYPADKAKVQAIVAALKAKPLSINGEVLTLARFLDLGICLGQEGGQDSLHQLLDEAFCDAAMTQVSWRFGQKVLQLTCVWEANPMYMLLHEAIYCRGFASRWAADRVKQELPVFSLAQAVPYFSGEMVRRHMLQDYSGLQVFSEAAEWLAHKTDWPDLYDTKVLAENAVPLYVLLMSDDFYVDYGLARQVLDSIANVRLWCHHTWQHDALRKHGKAIMRKMLAATTHA